MTPTCLLLAAITLGLERPDVEFKVFQFPPNQIPRIDGDSTDWSIVPASYTIDSNQPAPSSAWAVVGTKRGSSGCQLGGASQTSSCRRERSRRMSPTGVTGRFSPPGSIQRL